jgi:hypothetical protein
MADDRVKPDQEMPEEDLHRVWQGRLRVAERHLQTYGNTDDRWADNTHALAGDFNSIAELGEEAIDVNMVRSTIKSTLPPLYVTEPMVTVTPTVPTLQGANNVENARYTEIELNYWLRELGVRQEVKEIVYDGELTNIGYAYVGWSKHADVATSAGPLEYSDNVKHSQPFVRRISPRNVRVPPGYKNLKEAPWVSIVFTKPLLHVQRKFGSRADKVPTRDYKHEFDDVPNMADSLRVYLETDDAKLVDVENIWDKETRRVYVVVVGHDQFLEDPKPWPWDIDGLPLIRYQPEHISDEYFGTPPTSYGLKQNKELNATRTAMRKNRNRTKTVIIAGTEDADLADQYAAADDGAIITADLGGEDVRGKLMPVPGVPLDSSDLAYDSVIKNDIREQFGLGAERRGVGDPNVDSATASANIEKGTQIRESDKSDVVRSLWLGITHGLWMILKKHPNIRRTRLIAGQMAGEYAKIEYTLEALQGEYNFRMDLGAMTVMTPREREARATLRYNQLRADPLVNPERLILDMLDAHQVTEPQSYLLNLRQPQQEHQIMLTGLPVEAHERDEHLTHLQQHDGQSEMWDGLLQRLAQQPNQAPLMLKMQLAQALMLAHMQDHMRHLQAAQGATGQQPGTPISENLLRNQTLQVSGGETAAELAGQPLTGS